MKKCVVCIAVMMLTGLGFQSNAQAFEIEQLLLDVEKLSQLRQILTDLKNGYEIVSSGYNSIKNISEGNFSMHHLFLDRLLEVSPVVKNYRRVADIISMQLSLVREYKSAHRGFINSGQFTGEELEYISKVYTNLVDQSLKNLEALTSVVTANRLRMSDDERLKAIDGIFRQMEEMLGFLRHFNSSTKVLAFQRAREQKDVASQKELFGVNH